MNDQQDLPADELQKDEVSEELQNQASAEAEGEGYNTPEDNDAPELRLQALTAEYARERAALAEQVSQLQEENDCLTWRVQVLVQAAQSAQATVAALPTDNRLPEQALGLDFSIPD